MQFQLKLSGSHLAAVATVGMMFGALISSSDAGRMAHYRGMDNDALLAELARTHSSNAFGNVVAGILLVWFIVFVVDALTVGYEKLWAVYGPDVIKAMTPRK